MKLTKNQLKTWNSQKSDIDMFSRIQNNFLEKFFRLNLIDYFDDMLISIPQDQNIKKVFNKNTKFMLNHLFRVENQFVVNEFEQKVHTFYKKNSRTFESGELQHAFKIRYCNWNPVRNRIKRGQLVLFEIKIKAQIQKLQKIPQKMREQVQNQTKNDGLCQDYETIKKIFQHYNSDYFNLFIVYFGDINFHLTNKRHYEVQSIQLFGKKIKLRIFTFFISKQVLLEKFRSINKINSLDHINDMAIQLYEIKRQKKRQKIKKQKESIALNNKSVNQRCKDVLNEYSCYIKYAVAGVFGVMGVSALYFKVSKLASAR